MKAVTCFIVLGGAVAGVVGATPPPISSGALQISSAPVAVPEDHGTLRGYKRIVESGQERYCRNEVATGSHLARNPTCLTYKQLQIEQARAREFLETVQRQSALGNMPANMNGMASGNSPGMGH